MDTPLYYVDFLREPTTNAETGEVVDAHPSFYESIAGGLPDIRSVPGPELLQRPGDLSVVSSNASLPSLQNLAAPAACGTLPCHASSSAHAGVFNRLEVCTKIPQKP